MWGSWSLFCRRFLSPLHSSYPKDTLRLEAMFAHELWQRSKVEMGRKWSLCMEGMYLLTKRSPYKCALVTTTSSSLGDIRSDSRTHRILVQKWFLITYKCTFCQMVCITLPAQPRKAHTFTACIYVQSLHLPFRSKLAFRAVPGSSGPCAPLPIILPS